MGVFHVFSNSTNGTKWPKASHVIFRFLDHFRQNDFKFVIERAKKENALQKPNYTLPKRSNKFLQP